MKEMEQGASPAELESGVRARALVEEIRSRGLDRVAHLLGQESEATVATLLSLLPERDVVGAFTDTGSGSTNGYSEICFASKKGSLATQSALPRGNCRLFDGASRSNVRA